MVEQLTTTVAEKQSRIEELERHVDEIRKVLDNGPVGLPEIKRGPERIVEYRTVPVDALGDGVLRCNAYLYGLARELSRRGSDADSTKDQMSWTKNAIAVRSAADQMMKAMAAEGYVPSPSQERVRVATLKEAQKIAYVHASDKNRPEGYSRGATAVLNDITMRWSKIVHDGAWRDDPAPPLMFDEEDES
jgi:hypothetical protein